MRCIEVHEVHPWYGEITRYDEITAFLISDLQIILSLLGTWFIKANPTDKSGKKMVIFSQNRSKNVQNRPKSVLKCQNSVQKCPITPKNGGVTFKILLMAKRAGYILKSYCWSLNLLGTRCPGAATIYSSAASLI